MRQHLFFTIFVTATTLVVDQKQFVKGQNPPCYFCNGDPDATISNPDFVLDLSELNLPVSSATCSQVENALESGLINDDQCEQTQTDPKAIQAQLDCGCSSISTIPPGTAVPTSSPKTFAPTLRAALSSTTLPTPATTFLSTPFPTTPMPTNFATLSTTTTATLVPTAATTDLMTFADTILATPAPSPSSLSTTAPTTPAPTSTTTALITAADTKVATITPSPTSVTTTVPTTPVPTLSTTELVTIADTIVGTSTPSLSPPTPSPTLKTDQPTPDDNNKRTRRPTRPPSLRVPVSSSQRSPNQNPDRSSNSNDF